MLLYLSTIERDMTSILVQLIYKIVRHVYFISKVFKGVQTRYQKIEKLVLAIVTTSRKLRPYFQGHVVMVKTNYHVCQVFKKVGLAGRMIAWLVEQSKYNIQYVSMGSIKSQALTDFVAELNSPIKEDPPS